MFYLYNIIANHNIANHIHTHTLYIYTDELIHSNDRDQHMHCLDSPFLTVSLDFKIKKHSNLD